MGSTVDPTRYLVGSLIRQTSISRRQVGPHFVLSGQLINCHHNYISRENHFGSNVLVTRKGAIRAREGDMGIIPGSMGAKSFIVRGKGNPDSFTSCSHGAGRKMSRTQAKKSFSLADLAAQTDGVECRKDEGEMRRPARTRTSIRSWPIRAIWLRSWRSLNRFFASKGKQLSLTI